MSTPSEVSTALTSKSASTEPKTIKQSLLGSGSEERYYTYILLNPLKPGRYTYGKLATFFYKPFYVGKGSGNRWTVHFTKAALAKDTQCNIHKANTINKINRNNLDTVVVKMLSNVDESAAYKYEEKVITAIGRCDLKSGPLTNKSGGGKGNTHCIPWHKGKTGVYSEETLKKRSESLKGKVPWSKGKTGVYSEESLRQKSESLKRFYQTEAGVAQREQMSKRVKKRYEGEGGEKIKKRSILNMTKGNPDYYKSDKFKRGVEKARETNNKIWAAKNPTVGFKCEVCGTPTEMPLNKFNKRLKRFKATVCMSKNPACALRAVAAIKFDHPIVRAT